MKFCGWASYTLKGGVQRFFSVVGRSKMLVGVELFVVQLHGDEPHERCDDLRKQIIHIECSICMLPYHMTHAWMWHPAGAANAPLSVRRLS